MKNIISLILFIFVSFNLKANDMNIGDMNIQYIAGNHTDILKIKTKNHITKIFQENLWNNADTELNLLSINTKELKVKLSYTGNKEIGYIYTFKKSIKNKSYIISHVKLFKLEMDQLCTMREKTFRKDNNLTIIKLIETNICSNLDKYLITFKELEYISKHYKLQNILTKHELSILFKYVPITFQTLTQYNNIAYYLQQAGANEEAVYLLEKIIKKFPKRTVAYINLGDAYWELGEKTKARKAYSTYIEQMCAKGLEKKIPKKVLKRVKSRQ